MKILDCINKALNKSFTSEITAINELKKSSTEDKITAWDLAITNNSCYSTPKHLPFSKQKLVVNAMLFTNAVRGR